MIGDWLNRTTVIDESGRRMMSLRSAEWAVSWFERFAVGEAAVRLVRAAAA